MRRARKILLYAAAVIAVLLGAGYFTITRPWFFRSQLLPRLGNAIGAPVTAERISWAPFSQLELTGLQVGSGATPFLRAGTVRCRYSLLSLLGGTVKVSELLLDGVRVNVVQDTDGKWNLPQPPPAAKTPAPPGATPTAKQAKSPKLFLTNLEVRDLRVVLDKLAGPEPLHAEVNGVGIRLPELAPGKPVKLTHEGDLKITQGTRVAVTSGHASGTLTAELGPDLMPLKIVQERRLSGLAGQIDGIDLAGHEVISRLEVERDGTVYRLREFRLEESAGGKPEATVLVTGTIELQPLDVELDIRIDPLSATAINLAGALLGGLDFGDTTAKYAGHVAVQRGKMLTAQGKLEVSKLTVRDAKRQMPPLPPMEFTLEHNVTVDIEKQSARLTALKADLKNGQADILRLELLESVVFAWADASAGAVTAAPAKMNLTLHQLDLALVVPFLSVSSPVTVRGGMISGAMVAEIADMGKSLRLGGTLDATGLLLTAAGKDIPALTLEHKLDVSLRDRHVLSGSLQTSAKIGMAQALQVRVGVTEFDLATREGKMELDLPVVNDILLGALPIQWPAGTPAITALNASAKITATLKDKGQVVNVRGNASIANLTLAVPDAAHPTRLQGDLVFDVEQSAAAEFAVRTFTVNLAQGNEKLVRGDVTGSVFLPSAKPDAKALAAATPLKAAIRIDQFNLALLAPFLPAAAPVTVRGGTLTATLNAQTTDLGKTLAFDGAMNVQQAQVTVSGKELPPLSAEETMKGTLREFHQLAANVTAALTVGPAPALTMTLGTEFDLTTKEGKADIELPLVTDALLQALPMAWPAGVPTVRTLKGSAKLGATLKNQGKDIAGRGRITFDRLILTPAPDATPAELRGALDFDVATTDGGEITVQRLALDLAEGARKLANVGIAGTFFLPPAKSESVLSVTSTGIDGQALTRLFPSAPKGTPKEAQPKAPSPPGEPGPVGLGGLWLTAKLDLKNLAYGEVQMPALAGVVRIKENRVEVKPLDLTLNGAQVHFEATADLGKPGYEYSLAGNLAGLPLEPFMATFAPALRDSVQGNIKTLELKATGAGITPPNLQRNFRGRLNLVADRLVLQKLEALTKAANQTGIPELERLTFDTLTIGARDEKGRIRLDPCTAAGQDLKLDVTGTVDFDSRLDLLVRIGVAGAIKARLEKKQLAGALGKKEGNYSMLGLGLPLRGYPAQLNATNLILGFLAQNLTQAAVNTLGNVLKDAAEGKKIDANSILNGLLGGEKTNPSTVPQTPAPPPAPGTVEETPPGTPTPATPPAEPKPKKPKKPKTKDLLIDIGAGLLQEATEGKP